MKYIVFVSIVCFVACDPARRIHMKNKTGDDAEITWQLKDDSAKLNPLFISNSTEVKFQLKPVAPHNEAKMSFGIGSWTRQVLNNFVDDLEFLEIKSKQDSIKLTTEKEIKDYLLAHRRGLGKTLIRIFISK
ncbi:MAG: hypothetical protein ICV66_05630 [Chitinophagaceae bacterium]|nr:hypothetical protein [Chitinophagaceae bacterium]